MDNSQFKPMILEEGNSWSKPHDCTLLCLRTVFQLHHREVESKQSTIVPLSSSTKAVSVWWVGHHREGSCPRNLCDGQPYVHGWGWAVYADRKFPEASWPAAVTGLKAEQRHWRLSHTLWTLPVTHLASNWDDRKAMSWE